MNTIQAAAQGTSLNEVLKQLEVPNDASATASRARSRERSPRRDENEHGPSAGGGGERDQHVVQTVLPQSPHILPQPHSTEQFMQLLELQNKHMMSMFQQFCAEMQANTVAAIQQSSIACASTSATAAATAAAATLPAASVDVVAAVAKTVIANKNEERAIDTDLAKTLSKVKAKYVGSIRRHIKSQAAMTKEEDDLSTMSSDTSRQRYPAGTRPYTSSDTFVELDETWSSAKQGSVDVHFSIPQGSSIRKASQIIHWESVKLQKVLRLEATKSHAGMARRRAGRDALEEEVRQAFTAKTEAETKTTPWGMSAPTVKAFPPTLIAKQVEAIYAEAVGIVKREEQERAAEKEKQKAKKDLEERALLAQSPATLLKATIKQTVTEELKAMETEADANGAVAMDDDDDAKPPDHAELLVETLQKGKPKNDKPQFGGTGNANTPKGKGKTDAKSGGKGRAKQQPQQTQQQQQPQQHKGKDSKDKGKGKGGKTNKPPQKGKGKKGTKGENNGSGKGGKESRYKGW
eukprot:811356-Amphidinium_carterae.1